MKELKFKVGDLILWCGEKDKVTTIVSMSENNEFNQARFDYEPINNKHFYFRPGSFYFSSAAYGESLIITSKLARLFYV